ncbi:hypothetical protein [Pedobacter boryungensis]|uniref:Uncharacterized protein n=1 Tax=Pedobacter boryungensis TaxID=869962 RepID=A0ABX2DE76_9SPHI|nr:hypothetical protein [Pedobacter boryungensis]NQX32390.1 hypothetical protein [Pedobacter boryungensis]
MKKKEEDMEWEMEAPHLASLSRTTPYSAPDNYFKDLTTHINQSVFVASLTQKENPGFTVPQNYFEELGTEIESRIAVDQLYELAKSDGFKTPANYFDKLNADILSKTSGTVQKTKVVRLWQTDFMKYAAAACFILLTASGLYFNQQNTLQENRTSELASEQMLYDIDESVIIDHIQESQTASTSASDTEMENYILDHFSSSDLSNNL